MKDRTNLIGNFLKILLIISVLALLYYMLTYNTAKNRAINYCKAQDNNKTRLYTFTRQGFSSTPENMICTDNITFAIYGSLMKTKNCDQQIDMVQIKK